MTQPRLFKAPGLPHNEAHLSGDGLYRWRLWRAWGTGRRQVAWLMLNPSTADATFNDPTLKRCIKFSQSWGFDGLVVVNLHPYRTSDPSKLPLLIPSAMDRNRELVFKSAEAATLIVVAWGNGGAKLGADELVEMLPAKLHCLGTTNSGAPKHPLARGVHRVPDSMRPQLWTRP